MIFKKITGVQSTWINSYLRVLINSHAYTYMHKLYLLSMSVSRGADHLTRNSFIILLPALFPAYRSWFLHVKYYKKILIVWLAALIMHKCSRPASLITLFFTSSKVCLNFKSKTSRRKTNPIKSWVPNKECR